MRRRGWAVGIVAAVAAAIVTATPALAAPGGQRGDTVAATVPPGSQVAQVGHYYLLTAHPGDSVTQKLRVTNPNDHAVTVLVEAVEATTGNATGVVFGTPGSAKATTSRWVEVTTPEVTLGAKEFRDVPFTVHVPTGISAGQYLAGVSASVPVHADATPKPQLAPTAAGFSMSLRFQRAIAVEVDVPGPRAPALVLSGADASATPDGVALGVHIANNGNAFAHGNGVIRVVDTNTDYSFKIDTFVPHTAIVYSIPWTKQVVSGLHRIQVDLNYEGGRRTSWNGTINIAGDLQNQLESKLRTVQVHGRNSTMLWLLLALGVLLAFVAGAIHVRRRARRGYVKYRAA